VANGLVVNYRLSLAIQLHLDVLRGGTHHSWVIINMLDLIVVLHDFHSIPGCLKIPFFGYQSLETVEFASADGDVALNFIVE
jgi:hypothetical protein